MNTVWDVIVIGAGAAGLMAAIQSAERGLSTLLLEKNRKPGVKILMSGGTRCNITHATDRRGILGAFGDQARFLRSALHAFGPEELITWIEAEGVKTKTEPTGKVFPVSDRAVDVLNAFLTRLGRSDCRMHLNESVRSIHIMNHIFEVTTVRQSHSGRNLVITTGGQSYPSCGTCGDGYEWARQLGHAIVSPRPALVPITSDERCLADLQGITIPEAIVSVWRLPDSPLASPGVRLESRRGSLLFAHFGVSGPSVLDVSRVVTQELESQRNSGPNGQTLELHCDFLPSCPDEQLVEMIREGTSHAGKRLITNWLASLVPKRLADTISVRAGLGSDQRLAELARHQRTAIVRGLKGFDLHITGTRGFKKAEVTAGGVDLAEIDPKTMRSKRVPGLYFAGEILDVDGPIGGYNFQAAFSTGYVAGNSVR
jgi:hypothetical protein